MSFVVNGANWNFTGCTASEVEGLIDQALAFVETSIARDEAVLIGDDFQIRPVYGIFTIWDLFAEDSPIRLSSEIRQELAAWLGRADRYADSEHWPDGATDTYISTGGAAWTDNTDVAWVHHCIRAGKPTACFTLEATSKLQTETAAGTATLHFVGDEEGRKQFWRDMILFEGDNLDSLLSNAPHAYPELYFVDGVLKNLDRFSGGYLASRHRVQTALAGLNDGGHWAFTWPPPAQTPNEGPPPDMNARPNNQLIQRRLTGFGLNAAPENPDVGNHRVSREARETTLGARKLYCEWHIKLQLYQNRIHFHGPVPESSGRVVVAMIDEHLPLPT